jgi:hypothetical protein
MTFDRVNRRTHLYLAMFLMPWFRLYGVSSVVFNHLPYFRALYDDGVPAWTVRFEREYHAPPIPANADLRAVAAKILKDNGVGGEFYVFRTKTGAVNITQAYFLSHARITYWPDQHDRVRAEDRRFRWDQVLIGMHAREGLKAMLGFFRQVWRIVGVDLVVLAMLVWVASGIHMWWHIPQVRFWGWIALGAGATSFLIFLVCL